MKLRVVGKLPAATRRRMEQGARVRRSHAAEEKRARKRPLVAGKWLEQRWSPFRTIRSSHWPFVARVLESFPPERYPKVLDVGGAGGYMAIPLSRLGYDVTIIDPRVHERRGPGWRNFPRIPPRVTKIRRKFLVQDAREFDLLVGFFPCGASPKLIRAAKRRPLVFQPCYCCHHWPGNASTIREIASYFENMGVPCRHRGRVFWTPPKLHPPRKKTSQ